MAATSLSSISSASTCSVLFWYLKTFQLLRSVAFVCLVVLRIFSNNHASTPTTSCSFSLQHFSVFQLCNNFVFVLLSDINDIA